MAKLKFVVLVILKTASLLSCLDSYKDDRFLRARSGLTEVPSDIPPESRFVDLFINEITVLKAFVFSHLASCVEMNLCDNKISVIEKNAFSGLTSIKYLDLSRNRLSYISQDMLQDLYSLEQLNLKENSISTDRIHKKTFINNTNLKILSLERNNLTNCTINSGDIFEGLESLETLHMGYNTIVAIDNDTFEYLPRPFTLDLRGNVMLCDSALCWLKEEQRSGTIILHRTGSYKSYEPSCQNGTLWNNMNWTCLAENESGGTAHAESDSRLVFFVIIGVVIGVIVLIINITVVVCMRRKRNNRCPEETSPTIEEEHGSRNVTSFPASLEPSVPPEHIVLAPGDIPLSRLPTTHPETQIFAPCDPPPYTP